MKHSENSYVGYQLVKAGGLSKQAKENPDRLQGSIESLLYALGGKKLVDWNEGAARGKRVFWHGTNPSNVANIKEHGIKTMGQALDRGHSVTADMFDAIGQDVLEKSKNMAFVGPKNVARQYNVMQYMKDVLGADAKGDTAQALWNKFQMRATPQQQWNLFKNFYKSPLKVEISEANRGSLKTNPEYTHVRKTIDDLIDLSIPEESKGLKRILKRLGSLHPAALMLNTTRGVEHGVRPSEIVGGRGYKWISPRGIAKNPLRFARGLGLTGLGLGLGGYGLKGLYDNITK